MFAELDLLISEVCVLIIKIQTSSCSFVSGYGKF